MLYFVFYLILNSTLAFSSLKNSNPIIFPARMLSTKQAGHTEQSTHPDWHKSSLYSPAPPLETYFRMSQAHTHCFQTNTHLKWPRIQVSFATQGTISSLSHLFTLADKLGSGGRDNTRVCLLFSLKSERTANQLHISLEPDHNSNPAAPGKKEWNKTWTQYPL